MSDELPASPSIEAPEPGERITGAEANLDRLAMLARRRSTAAVALTEPAPNPSELKTLLQIAQRVPDHGKLTPWRFVIFEGPSRENFGNILAKVAATHFQNINDEHIEIERNRLTRAPLVVAVISTVIENHKIPEWEQILSAGAVCQNMLLAANAMGYGGQWLTEWFAYHPSIRDTMELRSGERIAGFMHFGTPSEDPVERLRPTAGIEHWQG